MEIVVVNTESPAWHAGIKHGDVLLEIDDYPINKIADYRQCLSEHVAKRTAKLNFKVVRKGQVKFIEVKL